MKMFLLFCMGLCVSAGLTYVLLTGPTVLKERIKQAPPPLTTSFSLKDAPKDSITGQITSLAGDVAWQSRVATQPAQLTTPGNLLQGENILTKNNGKVTVNFPDDVTFSMLSNAEVDVIQTLPESTVFVQQDGIVMYTSVGKEPVGIRTLDMLIQQQKGSIRVIINKDLETVAVSVTDGTATAAYTDSNNTSIVTPIALGQTFTFDEASLTGAIQ